MKGRKRQLLMKKQREKNKTQRENEERAYRELMQNVQTAASNGRKVKPLPKQPSIVDVLMDMDMTRRLPSACDRPIEQAVVSVKPELSEDMVNREAVAQKEAERRKGMVAPLYNKGCYQYIGDAPAEILQGLGRKL